MNTQQFQNLAELYCYSSCLNKVKSQELIKLKALSHAKTFEMLLESTFPTTLRNRLTVSLLIT